MFNKKTTQFVRKGFLETRPSHSDPEGSAILIFVHGLSSTPAGTWRSMMDLCKADPDFNDFTLSSYSYPTKLVSWFGARMPTIQELSDGLKTELITRHQKASSVVIACHSLGGVIARNFILNELKSGRSIDKYELILFAVPNKGAKIADFGQHISLSHNHLRQLGTSSDLISILNEDWNKFDLSNKVRMLTVVGSGDRVVDPASGRGGAESENLRTLVHYNHGNITKAQALDDDRYLTLKQFALTAEAQTYRPKRSSTQSKRLAGRAQGVAARASDPLFDIYRPEDAEFYVERSLDNALQTGGDGHIWISGGSGFGKTTALRRLAFKRGALIQISLGGHKGSSNEELFWAIAESLADWSGLPLPQRGANVMASALTVSRKALASRPERGDLTVLIEEIPVSEGGAMASFLEGVVSLCLELDSLPSGGPRVRLGFSSIVDPKEWNALTERLRERVQMFQAPPWSAGDCMRLTELLSSHVRPQLSKAERQSIADAASGSPRLVKMVFRRWRSGTDHGLSVQELLSEVILEQVK